MIIERARFRDDMLKNPTDTQAYYSEDRRYRYYLAWRWSDAPAMYVCMLNPSTATHEVLDPTVSGLIKRARQWGYGAVAIVNLFGLRATKPEAMLADPDPVGPDNDSTIWATLNAAYQDGCPIICGWGTHGEHMRRDLWMRDAALRMGVRVMALGFTKSGQPGHPLYIRHETRPQEWK